MRFLLIFLLLVGPAGCAQSGAGTIRGFICDVSWNAIRGATVEARNAQTSMTYSTLSAGNGNYAIADLPPGEYTVTVARLLFLSTRRQATSCFAIPVALFSLRFPYPTDNRAGQRIANISAIGR